MASVLTVSAALAVTAACSSGGDTPDATADGSAGPPKEVSVVTDVLTTVYTPLYTADKLGIFAKHGLSVKINTLQSGSTITAVIQSGSVDIAASGAITQALAVKQGAKFTAIASEGNASAEVCARPAWLKDHNLTAASSPDAVFKALKGGKFGTTGVGGTPDLLMRFLASTYGGLNPATDFQTVALGSAAGVATAMKDNAVDVTLASPPQCQTMVAAGSVEVVLEPSEIPAFQELPYAVIYASSDYINHNQDVAKAFAASIVEAEQYAKANPDKVVTDVLQPYFPTTDAAVLKTALNNVILPQMPTDGKMTQAGWEKVNQVLAPVNDGKLDTAEGALWTNKYLPSA